MKCCRYCARLTGCESSRSAVHSIYQREIFQECIVCTGNILCVVQVSYLINKMTADHKSALIKPYGRTLDLLHALPDKFLYFTFTPCCVCYKLIRLRLHPDLFLSQAGRGLVLVSKQPVYGTTSMAAQSKTKLPSMDLATVLFFTPVASWCVIGNRYVFRSSTGD